MSGSLPTTGSSNSGTGVHQYIVQNKHLSKVWVETGAGCLNACTGVAVGSDGNVWATDLSNDEIYIDTMTGGQTQDPLPTGFQPGYLAVGPDGDMYVTGFNNFIVQVTKSGGATPLSIPSGDRTFGDGIVEGSNADWFIEDGHVGKVTPDGTITEFKYPSGTRGNGVAGITIGPDDRVWFVDNERRTLGSIDQSTGTIVELPNRALRECAPHDILSAAGVLWVGCSGPTPELLKVTTQAKITHYKLGFYVGQTPESMIVGPNGDPWMVTPNGGLSDFDPRTNSVTTYFPPPGAKLGPTLTLAPDGNAWIPGNGFMYAYLNNILTVRPKKIVLSGAGATGTLDVSEPGTDSWSATSSKTAVAIVAQGSTNSQFIVTGVASGRCTITISDTIGNSIAIPVVVN